MALTKLLFQAKPQGHPAYTFERSSSAYAVDSDGVLAAYSSDALREHWLDLDGDGNAETPAFLLERASSNELLHSGGLDEADWSASQVSVSSDAGRAADGSTTAELLQATTLATVHYIEQSTFGAAASTDHALSVYASPNGVDYLGLRVVDGAEALTYEALYELTSSGAVVDSGANGGGTHRLSYIERLRADTYRCVLVGSVSTSTEIAARIYCAETSSQMVTVFAGSGSSVSAGVLVWGAQLETGMPDATSLMPTSSAGASRANETLYFDFPYAPQAMTVYVRFVEHGGVNMPGAGALFQVGSATASEDPRFLVSGSPGFYRIQHDNGHTNPAATLGTAPSPNEETEIRAVLRADGSILIGQSIESGAETTVSDTTPAVLAAAWAGERLYLNSRGTDGLGIAAYIEVKVEAGEKSMAEMRSLDPMFSVGGISVAIAMGSISNTRVEIGDRSRTFDGTLRETVRARVSDWEAETVPLTLADANDVQSALEASTQPQTAYGAMIASSSGEFPEVFTRVLSRQPVQSGGDRRYVLGFRAEESS